MLSQAPLSNLVLQLVAPLVPQRTHVLRRPPESPSGSALRRSRGSSSIAMLIRVVAVVPAVVARAVAGGMGEEDPPPPPRRGVCYKGSKAPRRGSIAGWQGNP